MLKTISVTAKNKNPLNEIADYLLENASNYIDKMEAFELITGQSAVLGGGEPPVTRINISVVMESPTDKAQEELDIILSFLKKRAIELSVEVEFEQD